MSTRLRLDWVTGIEPVQASVPLGALQRWMAPPLEEDELVVPEEEVDDEEAELELDDELLLVLEEDEVPSPEVDEAAVAAEELACPELEATV